MNLKEKEWVLNHREQFELLSQGEYAKTLKLHPTTIYRWQIRAENGNLENEPPLPHTFPQATSLSTVERVLKTYLEFPGWGGKKISEYLLNNGITYLSPTTAQKIKNKVNKLIEDTEYELKVKTRYQALKPNDIWAIDFLEFKWYGQKIYIALLIDDHSRFILNWFLSTGPTTNLVVKMIDEAKKQYGKPQVIKSDNGPQFRKAFRKELERCNIIHLNSPVFTPSFNGKVERVNLELRQIISNLKDLIIPI
jgi:transposase InsO family protein